jgi:phosphosulfolactate synthase
VAVSARSKPEEAFFPAKLAEDARHGSGVTHLLDRLEPVTQDWLDIAAPYVDVVKLGWGLPLLLSRDRLARRIRAYHDHGVKTSSGGTLLEYAVVRDRVRPFLDEARALGFDIVEISDGIIDLPPPRIERLAEDARRFGFEIVIEVGKKNPQNQLSLHETMQRISQARQLKPRRVILESRESGRGVGIYDGEGNIKWDWVRTILADHPMSELLFEAPQESQQIALLVELGSDVNLGNVAISSALPLATQRLGLRGDTFGTVRSSHQVGGSPATKFVYFLLDTYHGLDQTEIVRLSQLPRRTVQSALEDLRRQGLVNESVSLVDSRRRLYRLT